MGAVPGLDYSTPASVDRARLPRANARPEVRRHDFGGEVSESLDWGHEEHGDEWSSLASPVNSHLEREDMANRTAGQLLQQLWEALELPGTGSDYHFAMLATEKDLWNRRRADPVAVAGFERVCWLDVQLIGVLPDVARFKRSDGEEDGFLSVPAFGDLIQLYLREGRFQRAEEVGRIAESIGYGDRLTDDLRARRAVLEAEDAR